MLRHALSSVPELDVSGCLCAQGCSFRYGSSRVPRRPPPSCIQSAASAFGLGARRLDGCRDYKLKAARPKVSEAAHLIILFLCVAHHQGCRCGLWSACCLSHALHPGSRSLGAHIPLASVNASLRGGTCHTHTAISDTTCIAVRCGFSATSHLHSSIPAPQLH